MKTVADFLSKQIGGKLTERVYTDDAIRAMEAYAKYYHETEVKKSPKPDVSGSRIFRDEELREVAYQCWMNSDKSHSKFLEFVRKEIADLHG